jgi:hypothetical protein
MMGAEPRSRASMQAWIHPATAWSLLYSPQSTVGSILSVPLHSGLLPKTAFSGYAVHARRGPGPVLAPVLPGFQIRVEKLYQSSKKSAPSPRKPASTAASMSASLVSSVTARPRKSSWWTMERRRRYTYPADAKKCDSEVTGQDVTRNVTGQDVTRMK